MSKKRANPPQRDPSQKQTSISMDSDILALGKRMAAADDRSFSNFIERLIKEAAREAGLKSDN